MFVGYEIKTQQNQAKPILLETDIKLSQAVLDPSKGAKKEPVCLMVEYNKKQFIVAVLDSTRSWQCPLDLMFAAGSEVKFFIRGSGTVHLTGFEYRDDMQSELDFDTSSEEEEEEEEEEDDDEAEEDGEEEAGGKQTKMINKRATKVPVKSAKTNGFDKVAKKSDAKKTVSGDKDESVEDEDDSDDEDFAADMMDQDDDIDMSDEDDDDEEDLDDEDIDEESEADED